MDGRVESATKAIRAEKEASDTLASTRQEQITSLTADLEKSKRDVDQKHSIGMRWKTRADSLILEAKTRTDSLAENEKLIGELKSKVEGLTKELEASKAKIAELEKKVAIPVPAAATGAEASADSAELVCPSFRHRGDVDDQTSLRAEKEALQKELEKAKKDLGSAKAAPAPVAPPKAAPPAKAAAAAPASSTTAEPTESGPIEDLERGELENKYKELESDHTALEAVRFCSTIRD